MTHPDLVNIYRLLDVEEIIKFEKIIPRLLFALPRDEDAYIFEISPQSGRLYYSNYDEIWNNLTPLSLPRTNIEIIEICKSFFLNAREEIKKYNEINGQNKLVDLFPLNLSEPEISLITSPEEDIIDHILVRFLPRLKGVKGFGTKSMPVLGSSIDLRIGAKGKIIGLSSGWRPIQNLHKKVVLISGEDIAGHIEEESHSHNENDEHVSGGQQNRLLCYRVKGEDINQPFLCPYYLDAQGHHYDFVPASAFSLEIRILEERLEFRTILYPSVLGGSGSYTIEWSYWDLSELETSFTHVGTVDRLDLGFGAYNVALTIIDNKTKNREQTVQTVYVQPPKLDLTNEDVSEDFI